MGAQVHEQSIQKGDQHGKASWHRFFIDFGGFWEPSWEAKSNQDRSKMASKKRRKKERQQDSEKVGKSAYNDQRHQGSEAPGRVEVSRRGHKGYIPTRLAPHSWRVDPRVRQSAAPFLNLVRPSTAPFLNHLSPEGWWVKAYDFPAG